MIEYSKGIEEDIFFCVNERKKVIEEGPVTPAVTGIRRLRNSNDVRGRTRTNEKPRTPLWYFYFSDGWMERTPAVVGQEAAPTLDPVWKCK
jgi:hypothetical protein